MDLRPWALSAQPHTLGLEVVSMSDDVVERPAEVAVLIRGAVDEADVEYAVARIEAVVRHVGEPVPFARVKLHHVPDPARARPDLAEVALDIDGEVVRAHVAGHDMREAADLLQQRLRAKVEERAQRREWLRTRSGLPEEGQWRHGDLPAARPELYDRPVDERELVRHKTFAVDACTAEEAAFDMEQLDYDFFLFRELESGADAVLERDADGATRVSAVADAPTLTVDAAVERLDATGARFVFFADEATGRGNVVYRRYDGHYGQITPA